VNNTAASQKSRTIC